MCMVCPYVVFSHCFLFLRTVHCAMQSIHHCHHAKVIERRAESQRKFHSYGFNFINIVARSFFEEMVLSIADYWSFGVRRMFAQHLVHIRIGWML